MTEENMYRNGFLDAIEMLRELMYQHSFLEDTEMQKWDGGLWIRYKVFENTIDEIKNSYSKNETMLGA